MNRRDFFKIVTTSGATAAVAGCQQSAERILPLVVPNEQIVPGVATYFATVCRECPAGCGVRARSRDGRVVKLEGNPDHPVNQGALCVRGQAALQQVYHPDRFAGPQRRDGNAWKALSWDDALKLAADKASELRKAGKGRAIVVMTQLESGSQAVLLDRWVQSVGARPRVTFEPFGYEAMRVANRQVFGRDAVPYYAFEDAEVVLSFGADFLETWLSNVAYARGFARSHGFAGGRAGTFIHVEPRQSLTASNADQWVRNAPGTEGLVALAVLKSMVEQGLVDRRFGEVVGAVNVEKAAAASGGPTETLKQMALIFRPAPPGVAGDDGARSRGPAREPLARIVGRLLAARGRGRTDAAGDVAHPRLAAVRRRAAADRARRARRRGRQGSAALADVPGLSHGAVGAARQGQVGSGAPAGWGLARHDCRGGESEAGGRRRRNGQARRRQQWPDPHRVPVAPLL